MSHISLQQGIIKYIYIYIYIYTKKYFKIHIKPKIYYSLDKASYNESSLQYLYCA